MSESGCLADLFNCMPKRIVPDTLTESDITWENSHILRGDNLADQLDTLK